ncbi:uncharacterized protein LOC143225740 isoform X2 [Tachypleus tridentatus]
MAQELDFYTRTHNGYISEYFGKEKFIPDIKLLSKSCIEKFEQVKSSVMLLFMTITEAQILVMNHSGLHLKNSPLIFFQICLNNKTTLVVVLVVCLFLGCFILPTTEGLRIRKRFANRHSVYGEDFGYYRSHSQLRSERGC